MNMQEEGMTSCNSQSESLPVVEETVEIGRQVVDTASIRFRKQVDEEVVQVPFISRKIGYTVERVPVNQYVDEAPTPVRHEGKTMILSVVEEEVVIQKRWKFVEEIHIIPVEEERAEDFEVKLRKERILVKRDQQSEEKNEN